MVKFKLILLFTILSMTSSATEKSEVYTINFSEEDFSLTYDDSGNLQISSIAQLVSFPEANEPGLPLLSTPIAVGADCSYVSSSAVVTKHLLKSNVQVAQSPLPEISDNLNTSASPATVTYLESIYPISNCQYTTTSDWGNVKVLHFLSCPFIYDAAAKQLYFVDQIDLTIVTEDSQTANIRKINNNSSELVQGIVINKQQAAMIMADEDALAVSVLSDEETIDYLIVTNNLLKSSFEPLKKWKKTKGLNSKIITIEEIEAGYTGKDSQEKLKNCLYSLYKNNSLTFVLLGGDDSIVPVRGCYGYCNASTKTYIDNAIPTDLYYSCFGGTFDWDANENGIYGETDDSINLAQSIFVTRVPVRVSSDVDAFVNRQLEYERNPQWSNTLLMCGNLLWANCINSPSQSDAEAKGDNLYNNYIKPYWNGARYKFYDTYTDFSEGANFNLTAANLSQQLEEGYTFMDMATHGNQTGWGMETGVNYSSAYGKNQMNSGHTIVTTMACLTNAFDSSSVGGYQDPCLSESLIRNPSSGVVAYLGCSRYGWGYSGGTASLGLSLQYESHFYKNLFSSDFPNKNFGVVVAAAKVAMISQSLKDGAGRWIQFGLNPVGDPEMPVFISQPLYFDNTNIDTVNKQVYIDAGVEGCQFCVMSLNDYGKSYYKIYKDSKDLYLTDLPVECSVCITKRGYVPKQFSICIVQNEELSGENTFNYDVVMFGTSLTSAKTSGPVIIKSGTTTINASKVTLEPETTVSTGAELITNINK